MQNTRTEAPAGHPSPLNAGGRHPAPVEAPGGHPSSYLLPLLQLADSALPTGAFSHSFGLETFLERGLVHDEKTFSVWLAQFVHTQLTYSDGLAIRLALEAGSMDELRHLDAMLMAQALPRQVREAGVTMGARMLHIASVILDSAEIEQYREDVARGDCSGHPALAFALAGRSLQVPLPELLGTYLFSTATSLTQNAIRGIPIGQDAGQRVLRQVHPDIAAATERIAGLDRGDFGATAPGLEIAQMRHERQRARMFMS